VTATPTPAQPRAQQRVTAFTLRRHPPSHCAAVYSLLSEFLEGRADSDSVCPRWERGWPDGFGPRSGGVPPSDRGPVGSSGRRGRTPGLDLVTALADLHTAVEALPDSQRQAVQLYYLSEEHPTHADVGQAIGQDQRRVSELLREGRDGIVEHLTRPAA